jgi:hypothetical protein
MRGLILLICATLLFGCGEKDDTKWKQAGCPIYKAIYKDYTGVWFRAYEFLVEEGKTFIEQKGAGGLYYVEAEIKYNCKGITK